ncbi:MAG: sn-glycerol-1-phosphate dehydrogenase [Propionibacteriaceae bacterium]|jgi:glycerol-1-phosphate dehydrogenase [NAD(P)+]|nr:sn-glycerol-1-phosphate dehydrogenase [Propionibacteriaceae bacterium]
MSVIDEAVQRADQTAAVSAGPGALSDLGRMFARQLPGASARLVADQRTWQVAGPAAQAVLSQAGVVLTEPFILPGSPELYARYENVELVRQALAEDDAIAVAIGAGTLNDLVKRASDELGRRYAVVATAASMDGYTAFGASISRDGYKQTLDCQAPLLAVADYDIMAQAPSAMSASGYGDLLGKVVAGADWILADALGVEPIEPGVWSLVQASLRSALSDPAGVKAGRGQAIAELSEGLVMSGLAMQAYHGSRPASGSEHLFSHLWEMEGLGVDLEPRRLSHGFKVALGSIAMAALYELVLELDWSAFDPAQAAAGWASWPQRAALIESRFASADLTAAALAQSQAKYVDAAAVEARLVDLIAQWPSLRQRLADQLLPAAELQASLRTVGAPAGPGDIGLTWEALRDTYSRAQLIRSRYTVLDLLAEAGLLEGLADRLFQPDDFWGRQRG